MSHHRHHRQWERTANRRRLFLLVLVSITTIGASGYMAMALPHQGATRLEIIIVIFFALLFAWISIGFWTSMAGFFILLRKGHRCYLNLAPDRDSGNGPLPSTALLMPVYNEEPLAVFSRVAAITASLDETGQSRYFDFFVLSDTTDPDVWVEEEILWEAARRQMKSDVRPFYRHRVPNIKRKSGNIADFCRRWGRPYQYMVVLDADSLMSGRSLVRMVQKMEEDKTIGILQTVPIPAGKTSLLARVQQFAAHMYGPMFTAGLDFWQLGDAQYWGHNAIIRIAPFMKHCALPRLSGAPPLGGDIMSHDFVEAALMRRAGWGVWLACDLDGSYEEPPPTLIEELIRDRRWSQGNLQHLRMLFTRGVFPAHRYLFLNGAMAYISALLWLIFLSLSTIEAIAVVIQEPDYFPAGAALFPHWPVWNPEWMWILLVSTLVILFLPKLLSMILVVMVQRRASQFGGWGSSILSVTGEVFLSTLLAPLRMLAHSKFIVLILLGSKIGWNPAARSEDGVTWGQALRFHMGGMLLAVVWGAVVFLINRAFFWWLVPILGPLALAVPISVWVSRPRGNAGMFSQRWRWFRGPSDIDPPPEWSLMQMNRQALKAALEKAVFSGLSGFTRAVVDPSVNSLHCAIRQRVNSRLAVSIAERLEGLVHKAVTAGPKSLATAEKKQLLGHPRFMERLHHLVWALPDGEIARSWGVPC